MVRELVRRVVVECVVECAGELVRELDIELVVELEMRSRMAADTAWVTAPDQPCPLLTRLPTEQPDWQESHFIVAAALRLSGPRAHDAGEGPKRPVRHDPADLSHVSMRLEPVSDVGQLLAQLVSGAS